jgi:integrase
LLRGKPTLAPPKGGKTREVPLSEVVAVALADRLRAYPPGEDGLIFRTREPQPMSRTYYNTNIWKPALVTAGVEPTRANGMHALRHYYARSAAYRIKCRSRGKTRKGEDGGVVRRPRALACSRSSAR